MNAPAEFERVLVSWLDADGPGPLPREIVHAAFLDARTRPQGHRFGGRERRGRWTPALRFGLGLGLLITIALVAAGLVAGRPSPAPAVISNGWIAFSANQPRNPPNVETADIYLTGDGMAPRRIIGSLGDGVAQRCAEFSPDGSRLAYGEGASSRGPDPRGPGPMDGRAVVVVGLDRDGEPSPPVATIALPAQFGPMPCPEWSPSGTRLAFFAGTELWIADAASGETSSLGSPGPATANLKDLAWSPDESSIAVGGSRTVIVVPTDHTAPSVYPVEGGYVISLAWTPDGRRIVTFDGLSIHRLDLDGGLSLLLAEAAVSNEGGNVVVSPDGARIASVRLTRRCDANGCDSSDPDLLVVMDIDGSKETILPTPSDGPDSALLWSPDGQRLLYIGDGFVSVAAMPGSPPDFYPYPGSLEWMSIEDVSWQPVLAAPMAN